MKEWKQSKSGLWYKQVPDVGSLVLYPYIDKPYAMRIKIVLESNKPGIPHKVIKDGYTDVEVAKGAGDEYIRKLTGWSDRQDRQFKIRCKKRRRGHFVIQKVGSQYMVIFNDPNSDYPYIVGKSKNEREAERKADDWYDRHYHIAAGEETPEWQSKPMNYDADGLTDSITVLCAVLGLIPAAIVENRVVFTKVQ